MLKNRSVVVCLAICLIPAFAFGQQKPKTRSDDGANSGLVYGKNYAFFVNAPRGWVLDNERGKGDGLDAVFYPRGSSWAKAKAVLYANTIAKPKGGFTQAVAGDIADFRKRYDNAMMTDDEPLPTGEPGKVAPVKSFAAAGRQYDTIAYVDAPKVVVLLVLNCRDAKAQAQARPAFRQLVASYQYFTSKVTVETAHPAKRATK